MSELDDFRDNLNSIDKIPLDDLPTWMRQASQGIDWGIILAFLFSLLAALPFLIQEGLPHTNASENYVYMTANYSIALREGRFYPRWTSASLNGYGAPIPHYYPPAAPYSAALIDILFLNNTVNAVRLLYILSMCLAGSMMYVFVLRNSGAGAGLLASILYVYSPYLGITAPHILGSLPQVLSMALLPCILWATDRLLKRNKPFDFILVAFFTAMLILTDIHIATASLLLVAGFAGWFLALHHKLWNSLLSLFAVLLGFGLSSFYWIPAWIEHDLVIWNPPAFLPIEHVLTLSKILAPLQKIDLGELVHTPQFTLGLPIISLCILGTICIAVIRKKQNFYILSLIATVLTLILALNKLSEQTWIIGIISFCGAILGSSALQINQLIPQTYKRLVLPVMSIFTLGLAMPVWLSPYWSGDFGDTGLGEQIRYEQQGYGTAVLPPGSRVPVSIPNIPPTSRVLVTSYDTENQLRLPQNQLSRGKEASLLAGESHQDRFLISTTTPTEFKILRAYFPGWQAVLGGHSVPLDKDNEGLIHISVPAVPRNTELIIRLDATETRKQAWALSWLSAFFLGVAALGRLRSNQRQKPDYDMLRLFPNQDARLIGILLIGFVAALLLFSSPNSRFSLQERSGHGLDNTIEIRGRTGFGLEALSYRLEDNQYHIGDTMELMLSWRTIRPLLTNYHIQVSLSDANGIHWEQEAYRYPGGYPTRRWIVNRYVRDDHQIVLDNILPGEYQITIEIFDCPTACLPDHRLTLYDSSGKDIGQSLILPDVITIHE